MRTVQSGVCAHGNFLKKEQTTFTVTFSGSGSSITGHFWNLNFQAQAVQQYSGLNIEPGCPPVMTCTMGV